MIKRIKEKKVIPKSEKKFLIGRHSSLEQVELLSSNTSQVKLCNPNYRSVVVQETEKDHTVYQFE